MTTATAPSALADLQGRADSAGLRLVGHHGLDGHGDAMQVVKRGVHVYVAHVGHSPMALSILDCSDPEQPRLVRQLPRPAHLHCHKVQIAGDVLVQNLEIPPFEDPAAATAASARTGLAIFDLSDPEAPREIGFHATAAPGAHRLWFAQPSYAFIAATAPDAPWSHQGLQIVDLSDPGAPVVAGAWAPPDGEDRWRIWNPTGWYEVHGAIPSGDRAYVSCLDAGLAILDITDPSTPALVSHLEWTPPRVGTLHTALPLPGRGLLVAVEEALQPSYDPPGAEKRIWLVDIADERDPQFIAPLPVPQPADRFHAAPGRFGPHNVHENRPGSFCSENAIYATCFNAGLRVYDISDPRAPAEIAHFVPPPPAGQDGPMLNDLFVDGDGLIYATDRVRGGLYVLAPA